MSILTNISSPSDIKKLNIDEMNLLASEVRQYMFDVIKTNGGHLASNFGVVELTIALLHVFDFENDKIVWDVGHQSYVYKILTDRKEAFKTLRQYNGISGFPKTNESKFDSFNVGHSSTSISAGVGIARARDIKNQNFNVISVIGDGALTGGMAFEALNDLGTTKTPMIVILNDNGMSISKSKSVLGNCLNNLRIKKKYGLFKKSISSRLKRFPILGKSLYKFLDSSKELLKRIFVKDLIFDYFDIKYFGTVDGHDMKALIKTFNEIKDTPEPIVFHIVTKKGKGLLEAEREPSKYHGVAGIEEKQENYPSFSKTLGKTLVKLAEKNKNIVALTAAMMDGTGLTEFAYEYPERFFDVSIAEQHAVTCSAGMASGGLKPYCAIYSTFLQRAYDQVFHDVCLNNYPVVFCLDRSGVSGFDGATHNGLFDLSYLRHLPNMNIYAPKNVSDFEQVLEWAVDFNSPLAIRYPKNCRFDFTSDYKIEYGKWEYIINNNSDFVCLCVGDRMLDIAYKSSEILKAQGVNLDVVNACFVKPLDSEMLLKIKDKNIITMEDNVLEGGFYSAVLEFFSQNNIKANIKAFACGDGLVQHGSLDKLFEELGITKENLINYVLGK